MVFDSVKMSKKDLKQLGYNLCAIPCSCNVYNYENDLYYLNYDRDNIKSENLKDYIKSLKLDSEKKYYFNSYQVAYSCGMYGNSGQLHKVMLWCDNTLIDTFFTYYC